MVRFKEFPDFKPNLTPRQIFSQGAFGGTYFRDIHSTITGKDYHNRHKKYKCLDGISEDKLTRPCKEYDKSINKYGVKVGVEMNKNCGLKYWEKKSKKGDPESWIIEDAPFGWVEWYIRISEGKRSQKYDEFQIKRWLGVAGPKGRFRLRLIKMIMQKNGRYDDESISPAIRQTLHHWSYRLNKKDYQEGVKYIKDRDKKK